MIRKVTKTGLMMLFAVVLIFAIEEVVVTPRSGGQSTGRIATLYKNRKGGLEVYVHANRRGLTIQWNQIGPWPPLRHGIILQPLRLFKYEIYSSPSRAPAGGWVSHEISFLEIPLVVVLGGLAAYPVSSRVFVRVRRRRKGVCAKCSYDLTGNESGMCPECGTAIGAKR